MVLMHARLRLRHTGLLAVLAIFTVLAAAPLLHAGDDSDDYDVTNSGLTASGSTPTPSGNFQGSGSTDQIDINKDLGFDAYSTFAGLVDWKFTRKNHLTFAVSPFQQSRADGAEAHHHLPGASTFDAGLTTNANLKANLYAPGYQYDIIRRKRGHLGVAVQLDLFDTKASLMAQRANQRHGMHHGPSAEAARCWRPFRWLGRNIGCT